MKRRGSKAFKRFQADLLQSVREMRAGKATHRRASDRALAARKLEDLELAELARARVDETPVPVRLADL